MSTGRRRRQRSEGVGIVGIDHVQLAMPRGEEVLARLFYEGVLGLVEVAKPRELRQRGGCWFVGDGVALHLGVMHEFRPATKAHPAFLVSDLEALRRTLAAANVEIEEDGSGLPIRRFYVADPFGNRIELVEAADGGFSRRRPRRSSRARTAP